MLAKLRCVLPVLALTALTLPLHGQDDNWNRFRGPNGAGVSESSDIATEWSAEKNIQWTVEMPGPGSSSPIVQDDKVFITCFTGYGMDQKAPGNASELKRHLLCLDRNTGKELWRSTVDSAADEDEYKGFVTDHGYASSTPVSDGSHVFGFFGKSGLVAWDIDGNQKWQVGLGTKSDPAKWGAGASPILYKDLVIVNAGIEGHALVALNKADGSEAWRVDNPKFTNSWSTPILVEVDGRTELIYSIPDRLLAFNPDDGQELWSASSPIQRAVTASVVAHEGVVYTLGGRQGKAIAVRCGGSGDVSETHTVWTTPVPSSIGTPLVSDDHLYWLAGGRGGGFAMCLSLEDGSEVNRKRLEGEGASYASPVMIGDKLVFLRRNGTAHVVAADSKMEAVTDNAIKTDETRFDGTPAIAGDQMFIRSNKMLYCIAKGE